MNPHEGLTDVEEHLRRLVQPGAVAVERVLAHALDEVGNRHRFAAWQKATAGMAVLSVLVGLSLWLVAKPRSDPATVTITGTKTSVVAARSDGRRLVVSSVIDELPRGGYVIIVEREAVQ